MGKTTKKQQTAASQLITGSTQTKNNINDNLQQFKTKPFRVLNMTFASKKVLTDFLLFSTLIIILPLILVYSTHNHVKDDPAYSELEKTMFSVGPSLIWINTLIAIYIYRVIKDPENYKVDEPLNHQIPVGLKQQNMNKRAEQKKKLKESQERLTDAQKERVKDKKIKGQ